MLRTLVKTGAAYAYTWSGAAHLSARNSGTVPFIVGYHRVVPDFAEAARTSIPSMLISTTTFEKHIDWLARRFSIVSLDEVTSRLEEGRRFERPTAAITFDDGYADVYHHAFPILKRKGIPAAVFVVTGLIGTSQMQLHDRLYWSIARKRTAPDAFALMTSMLTRMPRAAVEEQLKALEAGRPPDPDTVRQMTLLSWEMIAEMFSAGMTIGSHTCSHVLLTRERLEDAGRELAESRLALQEHLRCSIDHFSYPDGRWNRLVVEAAKASGYRFGYTTCRRRNTVSPLFTIPRTVLWEKASVNAFGRFSGSVMRGHAGGIFERRRCEHDHDSIKGVA
jgi:peptidoglycan/xylan/chitin deacetylase (PgdA/CDA1 family)